MKRIFSVAALLLFAASLIPLLVLAGYCGPTGDDFGYGAPVHFALEAGLGLPGAAQAVWENLRYTYQNWQGTFTSVLLFSVQPGAFSQGAYWLTVPVLLLAIVAPIYRMVGMVRTSSRWWNLLLGSVISLLTVQFFPSPAEGLYWWNGGAHYVLSWSLSVLVILSQLRMEAWHTTRSFPLRTALACVGGFLAGGGNYSTALVFTVVSGAFSVLALWNRRPHRVVAGQFLMTLSGAAGLLVSILAPGNAVRQASLEQMSALEAILASFREAGAALAAWTDAKMLAALLLCIPVFLLATRESGYRFRLPLLVLAGSFCAFAALYTPPLFAMGTCDVPRLDNLFWLAYMTFLFGNGFYLAGWAAARVPSVPRGARILAGTAGVGGVLLLVLLGRSAGESSACRAYRDLNSPELAAYLEERERRQAIAASPGAPFPRFQAIERYPVCFYDSQLFTWSSDLLVDGVPAALTTYHACGGEVTYVGLEQALDFFGREDELTTADFSAVFPIGREECVPLRELCERLGYSIAYDVPTDTLSLSTGAGS